MGFVLLLPQIALNLPVDSFCLWKAVIGIPCPGCGLTRALHFAFRFEWGKSLSFHPLGIPIAGAWFAIALMQATGIARNETIGRREMTVLRAVGRSFYILIVVVWIKVVLGGGI